MNENSNQAENLEAEIKEEFPLLPETNATALSAFFLAIIQGTVDRHNIGTYLNSNEQLKDIVSQLGLQSIQTPKSVVPIQGQMGDVAIGEVAGGNKFSIGTLTIYADPHFTKPFQQEGRSERKQNNRKWTISLLLVIFLVVSLAATTFLATFQQDSRIKADDYFNFEEDSQIKKWESRDGSTVQLSTNHAFTGKKSVAVTIMAQSGQEGGVGFATWTQTFKAESVIGRIFFPSSDNVSVVWAQVCIGVVGHCEDIPIHTNTWTTFVINLYKKDYNGLFLHEEEHNRMWFQGGIKVLDQNEQYTFYLDGIEIHP